MVDIMKKVFPGRMPLKNEARCLMTLDGAGQHMCPQLVCACSVEQSQRRASFTPAQVNLLGKYSTDLYISPPQHTPLVQPCDHVLVNKKFRAGIQRRYTFWMARQLAELEDHQHPLAPSRDLIGPKPHTVQIHLCNFAGTWVMQSYYDDVTDADIAKAFLSTWFDKGEFVCNGDSDSDATVSGVTYLFFFFLRLQRFIHMPRHRTERHGRRLLVRFKCHGRRSHRGDWRPRW